MIDFLTIPHLTSFSFESDVISELVTAHSVAYDGIATMVTVAHSNCSEERELITCYTKKGNNPRLSKYANLHPNTDEPPWRVRHLTK